MRAGDVVELRAPAEVLATLDEAGCLDGVPFMPEMLMFFGKQFSVESRVERACDTISTTMGVRRIPQMVPWTIFGAAATHTATVKHDAGSTGKRRGYVLRRGDRSTPRSAIWHISTSSDSLLRKRTA